MVPRSRRRRFPQPRQTWLRLVSSQSQADRSPRLQRVCRSAAGLCRFLLRLPAPASAAAEGAKGFLAIAKCHHLWEMAFGRRADPAPLRVTALKPTLDLGGGAEAASCRSCLRPRSSSPAQTETVGLKPVPAVLNQRCCGSFGCSQGTESRDFARERGRNKDFLILMGFPDRPPHAMGSSPAQPAAAVSAPVIKLQSGLFSEHTPPEIPANLSWSTDPGD